MLYVFMSFGKNFFSVVVCVLEKATSLEASEAFCVYHSTLYEHKLLSNTKKEQEEGKVQFGTVHQFHQKLMLKLVLRLST